MVGTGNGLVWLECGPGLEGRGWKELPGAGSQRALGLAKVLGLHPRGDVVSSEYFL